MNAPRIFEGGRVYFWLGYADDELTLPLVFSYQYRGPSSRHAGKHEFKLLGKDGIDILTEEDTEEFMTATELGVALRQWAETHPSLGS